MKITKRQRKAARSNAMVKRILANKDSREYEFSDRTYVGRNRFSFDGAPGIPFVRIDRTAN